MHSAIVIEQFRRRLIELGCPPGRIRRDIQELADHHEDLKNAALEEGLSEAAAEARAAQRLGEPVVLAEHLAAVLRSSSWWGRHPVVGFCLLPPITIVLVAALGLVFDSCLANLYFTSEELGFLSAHGPGLELIRMILAGTYYGAIALTAVLFCWLAWRSASGLNWAITACSVCLAHSCFFSLQVYPHTLSLGYCFPSRVRDLIAIAIPLLIAIAVVAWQQRIKKGLLAEPELRASAGPES